MDDYMDSVEEIFNHLAGMANTIAQDLQIAMLLAYFGDKNTSPFGHVLSSLQLIQEKLDRSLSLLHLHGSLRIRWFDQRGLPNEPIVDEL